MWHRLDLQVRWAFEDAQSLGSDIVGRTASLVDIGLYGCELREDLKSIRSAYVARNEQAGLCRSCPRSRAEGRKYCAMHLETQRLAAREWRRRQAAERQGTEEK